MNITKTAANSITIEYTDQELTILANDLLEPLDWLETAAREKLANCKSRFISEGTLALIKSKEVASIPTDEDELIDLITNHRYKSRKDREATNRV